MLDGIEVAGYVSCRLCQSMVLQHVAYQTHGVCFDCFLKDDMVEFREIEIAARANTHRVRLLPANTPKNRRKNSEKSPKVRRRPESSADLARLRACRRMAHLFPEVFALLYAEERWKAGLSPKPSRIEDRLVKAVETFVAFSAYYQNLDRSCDGEETEMVSDSDK